MRLERPLQSVDNPSFLQLILLAPRLEQVVAWVDLVAPFVCPETADTVEQLVHWIDPGV